MGFPTMKKALLEAEFTSFDEAKSFVGKVKSELGPNLARLDECKQLARDALEAVKSGEIKETYAKVGVVNGQLVFRIKHKKGHFGKDDIVLVEKYAEAGEAPDYVSYNKGKVIQTLDHSSKPSLTASWWKKALGDNNDSYTLGKALAKYEIADANARNDKNRVHYREVLEVIGLLEQTLKLELRDRKDIKNDMAYLKQFAAELFNAKSFFENKYERYEKDMAYQVNMVVDKKTGVTGKKIVDVRGALEEMTSAIDKGDNNNAHRFYAKVAKALSVDPLSRRELDNVIKDCCDTGGLNKDEFTRELTGDPRFRALVLDFKRIPDELAEQLTRLEQLDEGNEEQMQNGLNSLAKDPNYLGNLKELNTAYKNVLDAIKTAEAEAKKKDRSAKGLSQLNANDDRIPLAVRKLCEDLVELGQDTVHEYAKIRNNAGSERKKVKEYGIVAEDEAKFLTPVLNRTFTSWYKLGSVIDSVLEALKAVAGRYAEAKPEDLDAASLVNEVAKTSPLSGAGG